MNLGRIIYNQSMWLYRAAAKLASPFNEKADKFIKGRKQLIEKIENTLEKETAPIAWFHCASLGEFEQGRPVMEAFRKAYADYKILLTFFSPSGYEVRKNYQGADYIFYLPLDKEKNAERFIEATKPKIAFFVKYEFWYHYLKTLKKHDIPILSISAIFRPNQLFFKSYGGFYRQLLSYFDHFFVQNQLSKELLKGLSLQNATLAGDTRFDRVIAICQTPKKIPLAEKFIGDNLCMVIGSSWPADIDILQPLLQKYAGRVKFIVAPHEIGEGTLQQIEKTVQIESVRYSKATESNVQEKSLLLIDNIGMLSSLYALSDFAYVGGSFGNGLHNILEAATFGVPIFFGNKKYRKFQEAVDLTEEGGAFAIGNSSELLKQFELLFENNEARKNAGTICANYVQANVGATNKILDYVKTII